MLGAVANRGRPPIFKPTGSRTVGAWSPYRPTGGPAVSLCEHKRSERIGGKRGRGGGTPGLYSAFMAAMRASWARRKAAISRA